MADFTHPIVGWLIILGTLGGILFCAIILFKNNIKAPEGEIKPTGHIWDEDIEEFDNPLPSWWFYMFVTTIIFALGYLALYPGLGTYKGVFGWTSIGQYEDENQAYDSKYGETYKQYTQTPLLELADDTDAMKVGERLFASYCTVCHSSDARGGIGFPNLTDKDWLWGGKPEQIEHSIAKGRNGNMPAKGGNNKLSDTQVENIADYVLSLSGRKIDLVSAGLGEKLYAKSCIACHGPTGSGNQALGAANLADKTWLFGSSKGAVIRTIRSGQQGVMPAHEEFLGQDKVHLLAAYVYSLSK